MQTIEHTMYDIKKQMHCKLTYNDQIRRFIFNGTEFTELRAHIGALLSLPHDGFVLKYVDNESDLITLSSNEDLSLATEISDKILRLVVENPSSPKPLETAPHFPLPAVSNDTSFGPTFPGNYGRGRGRHGYGHRQHDGPQGSPVHFSGHHGRGWGHHHGHQEEQSWKCDKAKIPNSIKD